MAYGDILEINGQLVEHTPIGYVPVSPERAEGMLTKPAPTTKTTTPTETLPTGTPTTDPTKAPAGETGGFDPNGGPVGGVTEETGTDAPAPAPETGGIKPMQDVKGEPEAPAEMTFTFFEGAERGDASPTSLYGSREAEQVTEAELRAYFEGDTVNRLPEVFGDFDNYLAYMTEREELIQAGDYDVGNWDEYTGSLSEDDLMILEGEDLTQYGDDASSTYEELFGERTQNQSAAYNNWVNSEANQALLKKYGVSDTVYSETGDKFRWNGSAYVKTVNEDHAGLTDYVKMAMVTALTVGTGAAVAAVAPALGTVGSATLSNAITQAVTTGSIDPDQLLQTAATAGLGQALSQVMSPEVLKNLNDQLGFDVTAITGIEEVDNVLNAMGMTAIRQGVFDGSLDMDQIVASGVMTGAQELANFIMGPIQDAIKAGQPVTEEQRLEALRLGQSVGADAEEEVLRNMENTVNEALATQQSEAMTASLQRISDSLNEMYAPEPTPDFSVPGESTVDAAGSELEDTTADLRADTTEVVGPEGQIIYPEDGVTGSRAEQMLADGTQLNQYGAMSIDDTYLAYHVGLEPGSINGEYYLVDVEGDGYYLTDGTNLVKYQGEVNADASGRVNLEGNTMSWLDSHFANGGSLPGGAGRQMADIVLENTQSNNYYDALEETWEEVEQGEVFETEEARLAAVTPEETPDTPLESSMEFEAEDYEFEPEVVPEPPPEPEPVEPPTPTEQPPSDDGQAGATPPPTPAPTDTENPITTGMFPEYFPEPAPTPAPAPVDGRDGVDGIDGIDGVDGIDGIDGVDGQAGDPGRDGIDGIDGDPGRDGVDGVDGIDGIDGLDGLDGLDGERGDPGQDGTDGIDGTDGTDGRDGVDGTDGTDGIDGADGERGEQGPRGEPGRDADPEEIRRIIDSAVEGIKFPEGITTKQIEEILKGEIERIPLGVTSDQITKIVGEAIKGIEFPEEITTSQIKNLFETAIGQVAIASPKDVEDALSGFSFTESQINQIVGALPENINRLDLANALEGIVVGEDLDSAVKDIKEAVGGLDVASPSDVRDILSNYGFTEDQLEQISGAITIPPSATVKDVKNIVAGIPEGLTAEQVATQLSGDFKGITTDIAGVKGGIDDLAESLGLSTDGLIKAISNLGDSTGKDLTSLQSEILKGLGDLSKDFGTDIGDVVESVTGLEEGVADGIKDLGEQLTGIGTGIGGVDKGIKDLAESLGLSTDALVKAVSELGTTTGKDLTELESGILKGLGDLSENLGVDIGDVVKSVTGLEEGISEDIKGLGGQLTDIGTGVTGVQTGIKGLAESLGLSTEALVKAVSNLGTTTGKDLTDLEVEILKGMGDLSTSLGLDIKSVVDSVTTLGTGLGEGITGLEEGISDVGQAVGGVKTAVNEGVKSLADSLGVQTTDIENAIVKLGTGVGGDITELEASVLKGLSSLATNMGTDIKTVVTSIEGANTSLGENIQGLSENIKTQLETGFGGLGETVGEGLGGLGEGIAGLGQGLGAGLMGLAAQQAMMPGQIAAATPIQPVNFDPFRQGLTRRKLAQPLRIGMFTGGARNA